jgi:hypothetical protein
MPFVDDHDQDDLGRVGDRRVALEDFDVHEPARGTKTRCDRFDGGGLEWHADAHFCEADHLVFGRQRVAVHLKLRDDFGGRLPGAAERKGQQDCRDHDQRTSGTRMAVVTSACR